LLVEEADFVTPFQAGASETVRKVVTAGVRATEAITMAVWGRRPAGAS